MYKLNLNLRNILLLPIIFFFLPTFAFNISILKGTYLFFFIVIYICLLLLIIINPKDFINTIFAITKKTVLKYIFLFFILMVINSFILSFYGITTFTQTIRSTILRVCLYAIPIFLYFIYAINRYITLQKFVKFFILLFWINLIIGFIAYIGQILDLQIINCVFDFFANARLLKFTTSGFINVVGNASGYVAFGLPRLDNLHAEASNYALFLFLFLPFTYSINYLKEKIVKNVYLDIFIKKTIIPFTWLSLILTFSPMYLIFASLLTIFYYLKDIIKYIKQKFICFMTITCFIIIIFINIDLSETYLSRIINVLTQIHSFEDFILIEPSLADRIINYINEFCIFLKHPMGVGIGNLANHLIMQYKDSPVPLTLDIQQRVAFALKYNSSVPFDDGFIYSLLAEHGIIISSVFIYVYYKIFSSIIILEKIANSTSSINYYLLKSLKYTLACFLLIFFYDYNLFLNLEIYIIYTMALLSIYDYKRGFNE